MGCAPSQDAEHLGQLTNEEIGAIYAAGRVFGTLSFLGSLSIICCYFAFPNLQKMAFKLVLFMSMCDVMAAVGDFLNPDENHCATCLAQAWLNSIFDLSSVLWTGCITHFVYRAIRHRDAEVQRYEKRYHGICLGVPLVLGILPQLATAYGYEQGKCWIVSSMAPLRFVQFYIPLWLVIGFNVTHIGLLMRHLNILSHLSSADSQQVRGEVQFFWRLALYPMVLVVCWTPGTLNRLNNSFNPTSPVFGLYMAQAVMGSSQGLLNSMVYGMSPGVRSNLVAAFQSLLCKVGLSNVSRSDVGLSRSRSQARAGSVELREVGAESEEAREEARDENVLASPTLTTSASHPASTAQPPLDASLELSRV